MKNELNDFLEEHLACINEMQELGPDPYFYTRLKARMDREKDTVAWSLPLKPAWVIGILIMFLAVNGIIIIQDSKSTNMNTSSGIQALAASYDQIISD